MPRLRPIPLLEIVRAGPAALTNLKSGMDARRGASRMGAGLFLSLTTRFCSPRHHAAVPAMPISRMNASAVLRCGSRRMGEGGVVEATYSWTPEP